jgi:hypothetical protein
MSSFFYHDNEKSSNFIVGVVKLIGVLALAVVSIGLLYLYSAFSLGYVGMVLWAWFIVPVFGLPALSWGQAYGIALLIGLYCYRINTNKDERTTSEKVGQAIGLLLSPWLVLLAGWIGKTFFL